jgi:hypothetical protein
MKKVLKNEWTAKPVKFFSFAANERLGRIIAAVADVTGVWQSSQAER